MPGEPDPRYIIARRTLLDVVEALEVQRPAIIVVGAQESGAMTRMRTMSTDYSEVSIRRSWPRA